jgi:hypothetical protein
MGEKRKLLWVHPIIEKWEKENSLQNVLQKFLCDKNKCQNLAILSLETFGFIVNLISDRIRRKYSN